MSGHSTSAEPPRAARETAPSATRRLVAGEEPATAARRLHAILDQSYDVFLALDDDMTIVWASSRVTETLGWDPAAAQGLPVLDFVHPDDRDYATTNLARALTGDPPTEPTTVRARTADGRWLWVDAVGADLTAEPSVRGFVLYVRDVHQRQVAELARQEAEQALRRSEERFKALLQHSADAIVVIDRDSNITFVSPDNEILGHASSSLVGTDAVRLVHPDDQSEVTEALTAVAASPGDSRTLLFRLADGRGAWAWIEARTTNMFDVPAVGAIVANCRDVTEQVRAQQDAARLLEIFEITDDLVAIADPEGRLLHANAALRRHLGLHRRSDLTEVGILDLMPVGDRTRLLTEAFTQLESTGSWSGELQITTASGEPLPVLAQVLAHRGPDGRVAHYSAVSRDISERKRFEARLEHEATHDPLTGLPNRTLLLDRMQVALSRALRSGGRLAVLFLDLDDFKVLNDGHGHAFGDRLLVGIARRLEATLRPGDTVARFGGDEFVVLCEDFAGDHQVLAVCERIQQALSASFLLDDTEVHLRASIGVALYRAGGVVASAETEKVTPESLLRQADTAMYRAKERGRGGIVVFDETLRSRSLRRLEVETALRRAVERRELELRFQPIVDLTDRDVRHLEALVRWRHPDRGLVGPEEFVQVAEETGLIVPVGRWVLDEACRQLAVWRAQGAAPEDLAVAVNLSGRQLGSPSLLADLEATLEATGLPARCLTLEITESVLMDDVEFSEVTLARLHRLGLRLAVDDFGTGYSSLSYLRRFPVDLLKVDRSFVAGIGGGTDEAIVAAIVGLGEALGMEIVAEGVETEQQLDLLVGLGCHLGQGFLLAGPAAAEEVPALIGRRITSSPDGPAPARSAPAARANG